MPSSSSSGAGRWIGPYALLEELGRGGAAVVWRALDRAANREVALKLLDGMADRQRRRFLREAEALGRLRHPNIVAVHATGEHEGRPYLVLELVRGKTLEERLERGGPLPVAEAVDIARKLADALDHVHGLGLLHRDVKPENVLVGDDGEPRLSDFGLVKDLEEGRSKLTATGALMGTPGYWPPELAAGEGGQVGPAADVYGLGATLFALLTGRPPFVADSVMEALRAVSEDEPARPSDLRAEVDPALDEIVGGCLAKDPHDRYASCAAVRDALEAWRPGAAGARRRQLTGVLVGAALGSVLAAALALWLARPGPPAPPPPPPATEAPAVAPVTPRTEPPPVDAGARLRERLEQARVELASGSHESPERFEAAERLLGRVLEEDPTLVEALLLRADTREALGDLRGAFDDVSRALDLVPSRADLFARRSRLRLTFSDSAGALDDAKRAVALDPSPDHLVRLGRTYLETPAGAPLALEAVEQALARSPDHARALALRGEVLCLHYEDPRGVADAERAAASAPSDLEVRISLARVFGAVGDRRRALAEATAVLETDPYNADGLRVRAVLRLRTGDATGAIQDTLDALRGNPHDLGAKLIQAEALIALGRGAQAVRLFDEVIAAVPRPLPEWYLMRARCRPDEQLQEAIADCTAALRLNPDLVEAHLFRAAARAHLGDHLSALPDFDRVLVLAPDDRDGLAGRARSRAASDDLDGALADLNRLVEVAPLEVDARVQRARLHRRRGDFAAAVADLQRAADLLPPGAAEGKALQAELEQVRAAAKER